VTTGVQGKALGVRASTPPVASATTRARFLARPPTADWPATTQGHEDVLDRLTRSPFVLGCAGSQEQRRRGLVLLLDWLSEQPGDSWQDRWLASGVDAAGAHWRQIPAQWLRGRGQDSGGRNGLLCAALTVAICADVLRPHLAWFVDAAPRGGFLARGMAQSRDAHGFTRLQQACDRNPHMSAAAAGHTLHRGAVILAAKGGTVADITVGDALELLDRSVSPAPRTNSPSSTGAHPPQRQPISASRGLPAPPQRETNERRTDRGATRSRQRALALQAAAELIIGHRTWLHRSDFTDFIITSPDILDDTPMAGIDWPSAISALDTGDLPCSSSEQRILRLAASLADGIPVSLRDTLTGLDDHNRHWR